MKYSYRVERLVSTDLEGMDLYSGLLLIIEKEEEEYIFNELFHADTLYTIGTEIFHGELSYRYPFLWGVDLGVYQGEP